MTVLFRPKEAKAVFNNVDTKNMITNSNDETVTIHPGYYTLSEIIALLNTMTDTLFSISTNASSFGCIWIQSPHTIDFTDAPDIGEILGLDGRTVILRFERDRYHAKSPSDPGLLDDRAIIGSEDCEPEQQLAHHDDH